MGLERCSTRTPLSGCYASNTLPSMAARLSNEGVPVQIENASCTVSEAVAHLPSTLDHISPCFFSKTSCEKFLPRKHIGHTDVSSPDAPPLGVKVTYFRGTGTAIGILISHCFCDADSIMSFMQNWSRCYRARPPTHAAPRSCRRHPFAHQGHRVPT